jgi:FkbM family methyltransferase
MKEPRLTRVFFDSIWQGPPGFYVEIGAWDGRRKNSTILLEKAGWDGVCIEASPVSYQQLIKNRKCRCLNVAVYDRDGEVDFAVFPDRPEWNGIIETYDALHMELFESDEPRRGSRSSDATELIKVPCKSWNSLELPSHIDYLQIDVEGAELAILQCIDWSTTTIKYICLEDNNRHKGFTDYQDFMESIGYHAIASQHVDWLYTK